MNLSDEEIELLDRYLDNDLSEAEAVGLEAKLRTNPELRSELAALKEHRALRVEAFASMEATEVEAQQLQWYIRGAMRQQEGSGRESVRWFDRAGGWVGRLSKVAAVLVVGFFVGYAFRGGSIAGPGNDSTVLVPRPVAGGSGVMPVTLTNSSPKNVGGYAVQITDQFGKVVGVQQFKTLQEARDFANDLNSAQQRKRQLQNTGVRLIGDDF